MALRMGRDGGFLAAWLQIARDQEVQAAVATLACEIEMNKRRDTERFRRAN